MTNWKSIRAWGLALLFTGLFSLAAAGVYLFDQRTPVYLSGSVLTPTASHQISSVHGALRQPDGSLQITIPTEQRLENIALLISNSAVSYTHLAYKNDRWPDQLIQCPILQAQQLAEQTVTMNEAEAMKRDRQIDRILFSRWAGIPLMILLLCLVLWITLAGANIPSQMLAEFLFSLEAPLAEFLTALHLPGVIVTMLSEGMYRVLAWVVAVMLPPMAIFFPLFTYLEDLGYLPRVAFNLDLSLIHISMSIVFMFVLPFLL